MGGSTGGGGGARDGIATPCPCLCHPTCPPPPQTQKLLFKVPFSLPVAYGHEIFLENECSLLFIEVLNVLSRLIY